MTIKEKILWTYLPTFLSVCLIISVSFFAYIRIAHATIAVDSQMASNVGAGFAAPSSPQTFSFTNTAGTLLICTVVFDGGTPVTSPAVTYNSVSMGTADKTTNSSGKGLITIFHLLSPATGANTVSISWTGTALNIEAGCLSFTGNNSSAPVINKISSGGTSANPALAFSSVAAGDYTVAVCGTGHGLTSQTQTKTWLKNITTANFAGNGETTYSSSSGSVTHTFTQTSDVYGCVGEEIVVGSSASTRTSTYQQVIFNQLINIKLT